MPGTLFFALKGDNFDGNNFALETLEKGAAFAVVDGSVNRSALPASQGRHKGGSRGTLFMEDFLPDQPAVADIECPNRHHPEFCHFLKNLTRRV